MSNERKNEKKEHAWEHISVEQMGWLMQHYEDEKVKILWGEFTQAATDQEKTKKEWDVST